MTPTFKDRSRENWDGDPDLQHINAGSLQRIADGVEKMAQNHDSLLRAKKSAEDGRDYWQKEAEQRDRRIRSLRGYITRLKHKSQ